MRHYQEERKHLRELKWKELMSRVDAYRFYIKLILEVNAFYYATTGAVLLFYLKEEHNYLEFFLLLPILMGTVVGGFLIYASELQRDNSKIIKNIQVDLGAKYDMQIQDIPDLRLLNELLRVFGVIFFVVAVSLSWVPILRHINSWPSTVGARWSLMAFTLAGLVLVVAGSVYFWSMILKYRNSETP